MSGALSLAQSWIKSKKKGGTVIIMHLCLLSCVFAGGLACEEIFLRVDEVVGGLIHLNLTLPRLRHVPHPRVTGYDMKLK